MKATIFDQFSAAFKEIEEPLRMLLKVEHIIESEKYDEPVQRAQFAKARLQMYEFVVQIEQLLVKEKEQLQLFIITSLDRYNYFLDLDPLLEELRTLSFGLATAFKKAEYADVLFEVWEFALQIKERMDRLLTLMQKFREQSIQSVEWQYIPGIPELISTRDFRSLVASLGGTITSTSGSHFKVTIGSFSFSCGPSRRNSNAIMFSTIRDALDHSGSFLEACQKFPAIAQIKMRDYLVCYFAKADDDYQKLYRTVFATILR